MIKGQELSGFRGFEVLRGWDEIGVTAPKRATTRSAGYDLKAAIPHAWNIKPHEVILVPTGLTAYMQDYEWLGIYVRSSLALRSGLALANGVGVVDADYLGQHIQVMLRNTSDVTVTIHPLDRIAQAIFQLYFIADGDEPAGEIRTGGFGSTGRK